MAIDISAVGAKVLINPSSGSPIEITHFSDEGTPFEAGDVDVSTNQKNLNGDMISSRTPSVYSVSVTVVPGTDDDLALNKLLQESAIMPGGVTAVKKLWINSLILTIPRINESNDVASSGHKYKWSIGRIKSGPTGPSTSSEGRLSARTYTFEFEKYDGVSGSASVKS
jgi:hypothetical protein